MNKTLLIDICCGPCFSGVYPQIENFQLKPVFQGDNLLSEEEYNKRLDSVIKFCKNVKITNLIIIPYNHTKWLNYVKGFEQEPEKGKRCIKCFEYRVSNLKQFITGSFLNIDLVSTTLSISPHKNYDTIKYSFENLIEIPFYNQNYNQKDWFKYSVKRSKELNLYRQKFCGCEYAK